MDDGRLQGDGQGGDDATFDTVSIRVSIPRTHLSILRMHTDGGGVQGYWAPQKHSGRPHREVWVQRCSTFCPSSKRWGGDGRASGYPLSLTPEGTLGYGA